VPLGLVLRGPGRGKRGERDGFTDREIDIETLGEGGEAEGGGAKGEAETEWRREYERVWMP
jgi:hypothetical protein